VTNTAVSSARSYWDYSATATKGFFDVKGVAIPVAVSAFPDEIYTAPRSWVEESVSQAHPLQQASQRRALRGVGAAAVLFRGSSHRLEILAQFDLKTARALVARAESRASAATLLGIQKALNDENKHAVGGSRAYRRDRGSHCSRRGRTSADSGTLAAIRRSGYGPEFFSKGS
jgi:hypothetical protein